MDLAQRESFRAIFSSGKAPDPVEYEPFLVSLESPVDWAYELWSPILQAFTSPDNHLRSLAGQAFCRLALSDPEGRFAQDLEALLTLTCDSRFVTARHVIQSLWRIGLGGELHRKLLLTVVRRRWSLTMAEKNSNLVQSDLIGVLGTLYSRGSNRELENLAQELINSITDSVQHKKLLAAWKKTSRPT